MVKNKSTVRIIKKTDGSDPNIPVPMDVQPPRQQIDLSKRSIEDQIDILKNPYYSAHARTQREMDKLIENMLNMLVAKDNNTLRLTQENKKLTTELEKIRRKHEKKPEKKPNSKPVKR